MITHMSEYGYMQASFTLLSFLLLFIILLVSQLSLDSRYVILCEFQPLVRFIRNISAMQIEKSHSADGGQSRPPYLEKIRPARPLKPQRPSTQGDVYNRFRAAVARMRRFFRNHDIGADTAHQLKTPLAIMKMRLSEASDFEEREDLAKDLAHLENVVETMLMSARLDRVKKRDFREMDLTSVCRDVAAKAAPHIIAQGHDFEFLEEVREPDKYRGDRHLIGQAVHACLENAAKYSPPPGQVSLAVTKHGVEIRDRGPGVPKTERARIFRAYERGATSVSREGSGLGLSIASRIVALHGGEIAVSDRQGGGAVFQLRLR
ncbi:HAMP domain-containing sensor histidine kinase [Thalassococcus sp. S3]|uniref:sensor histidine kinase n=1 Tax=Thalassococcus sp. S3 TaxID=2017482 RepID=UPI0010244616|nr:HAMP domain-containing sensor histidine kinase [Thalassococcus sp. S3]QBF33416.1 hypothetical protein CFI11_19690 [Thalassococcus sp. S3]